MTGSEDFSYFSRVVPGCFLFFGSRDAEYPNRSLHTSDFDFNDNILAYGACFWVRLVEDRFGIKLLK